jgi:cytochrome c553
MKKRSRLSLKKMCFALSVSIGFLLSPSANAQSDEVSIGKGKDLFKGTCARCHAKLIGRKITGSPKLSNLSAGDVVARLNSYAQDKGDYSETQKYKQKMIEAAKALSASDIQNLAAYLDSR